MERIYTLHKVKISRIIFDVIRKELQCEDKLIENNPYYPGKCISIYQNNKYNLQVESTIHNGFLHFNINLYYGDIHIKRFNMFGSNGIVSYEYTRNTREDFEKLCIDEFRDAYSEAVIYLHRRKI